MSFSRLLRFFSNPLSITSSNSSAPEKEESSSNSSAPKKEESSSNSSAPKIMVSTSTSSIALLGVMLMASSTFIYYYFYSKASSSNSSGPKQEESSSNSNETKNEESSSNSSVPKKEESSSNSSEPKIMVSTSTSSIQNSFKYDVFLSFRGEDTRKNFVGHLYQALQAKGIETYKDDETIEQGERINDQLIKSIEESRFFIIIFSKTYASSSWCLDELVKIIECQKTAEQTAYPVFFDVEPTEIRKQSGAVEVAFAQHKKKEAAGKWRDAMKELADLAGWELKATANGDESKLIQMIVDAIFIKKNSTLSNADGKLLVGMETRISKVLSYLDIGTEDVRMIGIWGMGGGGKTTLARAVYDQISDHFEGKSFVENVREFSQPSLSGLKKLQKRILKDVLNKKDVNLSSVHDGKEMLIATMRRRKILVVLDDVDRIEQLEALAGSSDWFKSGSRIIITTRDEQVLLAHQVNFVHDVDLLSQEEAICLFSRNAFQKEIPIRGYEELSEHVVQYADGLPLTIKVLGSFLCRKEKLEWEDAIDRLKRIPLKETLEKLELSYISLEDEYKEIFLDIACILKGQTKEVAIRILESCGFHARTGLKVLEQRSLITISKDEVLGMHDHIEEMGENIVRRLHPDEPNKHSRLWIDEEIEDILADDMDTEATRCLKLYTTVNARIIMKALGKMKKLRYLEVKFAIYYNWESDPKFDDTSQYFTNSLKYLECLDYPFLYLPKTFQANNLVGLDMKRSRRMVQLWEDGEKKVLKNLKFLSLSESNLTTFDLIAPNLETLILQESLLLVKLCMPISCQKLNHLNISHSKLRSFDLGLTTNLETLSLESSGDLEELCMPVSSQKLKHLKISHSKLRSFDLGLTPNLETLSLKSSANLEELCMPFSCQKLKHLDISHSKLRSFDLGLTPNLETLFLKSSANLEELCMPFSCQKLKHLDISDSKLRTFDLGLTPNLETLSLKSSANLEELCMPFSCQKLKHLDISDSKLRTFDLGLTPNLETLYLDQSSHQLEELCMPVSCQKLKYLHISHSKLITFDLGLTPNLEMLSLESSRQLEELCMPVSCQKLKHLCISHSKLRSFDLGLTPNLEMLSLGQSSHQLEELCMPVSCQKLKHLCISHSKLRIFDLGLTPNIERLTLDNCDDFEELHVPVACPNLKSLYLWKTRLRSLDLELIPILETLHLQECNELVEINAPVGCLEKLVYLNLSGCALLEKLPEDIGWFECLKELDITDTGIGHLPQSMFGLKGLHITASSKLLELYDFPSKIETRAWQAGVFSTVL